ncbi:hypothetical protein BDD12DRAFT_897693 [Trichophaea hybrida]|nr:hypothetical protein BDD12DRAFT_897693 [Trichophaea hybrida]
MTNWLDHLSLEAKYAIGMGTLVTLVVCFAFFKLYLQKRRTRKICEALKAKAADEEGRMEQVALNPPEEEEGDLFGSRALERGFTGGVTQSRSVTPSIASGSTISLHRIPYGKDPSWSTKPSTIALDLGANSVSKNPEKPRMTKSHAVDMSTKVPDSPTHQMHPESPSSVPGASHPQSHTTKLFSSSTSSQDLYDFHSKVSSQGKAASSIADVRSQNARQSSPISRPVLVARPPSPGLPLQNYLKLPTIVGESGPSGSIMPFSCTDDHMGTARTSDSIEEISHGESEKDPQNTPQRAARSSASSLGDLYDSYYNSRLSTVPEPHPPPPPPPPPPPMSDSKRAPDSRQNPGSSEHRYTRMPSRTYT